MYSDSAFGWLCKYATALCYTYVAHLIYTVNRIMWGTP